MSNQLSIPASFQIYISYSQITVCRSGLESPFNNWAPAHVDQGFAWRPESVSFKTLNETGIAAVSVAIENHFNLRPDSIRAIQVPFTIPMGANVEIASITESKEFKIEPGEYALIFEIGLAKEDTMWCRFTFQRSKVATFKIVLADPGLIVRHKLELMAEPA
jgi:hypothetical protein